MAKMMRTCRTVDILLFYKHLRTKSSSDEDRSQDEITPERSKTRLNNLNSRFSLSSYHRSYVINKENFLYKRHSLQAARQAHSAVSLHLSRKFRRWHDRWTAEHVTDSQHKFSVDWLMGRGDGVVPNRTKVLTDNDLSRPPYRQYNRYTVERLSVSNSLPVSEP